MLRSTSRRARRWPRSICLLLVAVGLQLQGCRTHRTPPTPIAPQPSTVAGHVVAEEGDLTSVIVYLEALDQPAQSGAALPATIARVAEGAFSPQVTAVAAGQTLEFRIEGEILHRLFSYDEHNAFDLETSERQRSSSVTLQHPGLVHFYCSLHPAEGGRIFVAPAPYFANSDTDGSFRITGVPSGRYHVRTWSDEKAATQQAIHVPLAEAEPLEISLPPLQRTHE